MVNFMRITPLQYFMTKSNNSRKMRIFIYTSNSKFCSRPDAISPAGRSILVITIESKSELLYELSAK